MIGTSNLGAWNGHCPRVNGGLIDDQIIVSWFSAYKWNVPSRYFGTTWDHPKKTTGASLILGWRWYHIKENASFIIHWVSGIPPMSFVAAILWASLPLAPENHSSLAVSSVHDEGERGCSPCSRVRRFPPMVLICFFWWGEVMHTHTHTYIYI